MKVISLQSGSNGNCYHVQAGGARLVFDAGISGKRADTRLAAAGLDIRDADAVIISHDHADHVGCAGIYHRKFKLPVYMTPQTLKAAWQRVPLGKFRGVSHFCCGDVLKFDGVSVQTIPTPHDGADGSAFVIDDGKHRLGILTDLGHVFAGLADLISSLDAVILESNFDPRMLEAGLYPPFVKRRIRGPGGHLSNIESAELIRRHGKGRLQWLCIAHLSQNNNTPELALETHRKTLGRTLSIRLAGRHAATEVLEII